MFPLAELKQLSQCLALKSTLSLWGFWTGVFTPTAPIGMRASASIQPSSNKVMGWPILGSSPFKLMISHRTLGLITIGLTAGDPLSLI